MPFPVAERIKNLPPYLFAEIDRLKAEQLKKGVDVIDLGVGDPDLPTPKHIIAALKEAADDPANHQYPAYTGMNRFREAVARWMQKRFGVKLELLEVLTLIGSKEGISNFPLAFINPGDIVLIPSPGYPPYTSGTLFAGGTPYYLPLKRENRFLPDLQAIPQEIVKKARILHLNYPNNPTAAVATREFFHEVIRFAQRHEMIVSHDAAYIEQYEDHPPPSLLEIEGAREVAIEFHSLSKTYNMTGWRIGWACGNLKLVEGLGKIKENVDSGVFRAVQWAGVAALEGDQGCADEIRSVYRRRRKLLAQGLKKIGWDVASAAATFYVWMAVPHRGSRRPLHGQSPMEPPPQRRFAPGLSESQQFAMKVLEEAGVVITPGNGFGEGGEGYVRFSLTREDRRIEEALERLKKVKV